MDTKRIRCICGKIYDTASHSTCPECQAPPPFSPIADELIDSEPPLPIKVNPIMLDSDRKKRPHLYRSELEKNHFTIGIITAALILISLGSWFIFRQHAKPVPPAAIQKLTDTPSRNPAALTPPPSITPSASEAPAPATSQTIATDGLAAAIAAAKPGDTIKLPAGTYRGSFDIDRSIHLLGDNSAGPVIIQNETTRVGLRIKAGAFLILENLQITTAPKAEFSALVAFEKSSLELRNCNVVGPTSVGVLIAGGSKLVARKTTISTRGQGSGCQLEGGSSSTLIDCTIRENKWGYSASEASQGHATQCIFEQNGMNIGGSSVSAAGTKTQLTVEQSTFTQNPAGVIANEGSGIIVKSCTFKDNGITGEGNNSSQGLIGARNGSRMIVEDCTFDSNRQGVALLSGATAIISGSSFFNTGIRSDNSGLLFYCDTLSATGTGTKAALTKTVIKRSILTALNIVEGATLEMTDCQVSEGLGSGLGLGVEGTPRCEATAIRCHFTDNAKNGVFINAGSLVTLTESVICRNGISGIYLKGEKTALMAEKCNISQNQSCGIMADSQAFATAFSSILTGNLYGAQSGSPDGGMGAALILNKCKVTGNSGFGVGAMKKNKLVLDDTTVTQNKQNIYQARDAIVLQNWSGEKSVIDQQNNNAGPTIQTGGKTGMEPTR